MNKCKAETTDPDPQKLQILKLFYVQYKISIFNGIEEEKLWIRNENKAKLVGL